MSRLAHRLWSLPWPRSVRQLSVVALRLRPLARLLLPHFTVGVVGVIERDDGRVLLLRHTYRRRGPWGLPSGFVEHGEQPADALRREIEEETGLIVDLLPVQLVYTDRQHPTINVVYRGTVSEGGFRSSAEVSEIGFFSPGDMPPLPPAQKRILTLLERERGEISNI